MEQNFQADLLLLALGCCQKDLFEDDWLNVMVRVYWLKARFQALQVHFRVPVAAAPVLKGAKKDFFKSCLFFFF